MPIQSPSKSFPGVEDKIASRFARDVIAQERNFLDAISTARQSGNVSLEALEFLTGINAAQLSRYLTGGSPLSICNYLRIARVLGYQPLITWEKVSDSEEAAHINMKILPARVSAGRRRTL